MFFGQDFKQLFHGILSKNSVTPDLAILDRYEFQLLFVVDQMKLRNSRYQKISDSCYVGAGFTRSNFYFHIRRSDGLCIPIPTQDRMVNLPFHNMANPCKIKGELHIVKSEVLYRLDREFENGVQFERQRPHILFPYREVRRFPTTDVHRRELPEVLQGKEDLRFLTEEKIYQVKAHMYVGKEDVWNNQIDGGYEFTKAQEYSAKNRRWLRRYYDYREQDY